MTPRTAGELAVLAAACVAAQNRIVRSDPDAVAVADVLETVGRYLGTAGANALFGADNDADADAAARAFGPLLQRLKNTPRT